MDITRAKGSILKVVGAVALAATLVGGAAGTSATAPLRPDAEPGGNAARSATNCQGRPADNAHGAGGATGPRRGGLRVGPLPE
jgi:hypothetical protein